MSWSCQDKGQGKVEPSAQLIKRFQDMYIFVPV